MGFPTQLLSMSPPLPSPSRSEVYDWAMELQVPPLHTLAVRRAPADTPSSAIQMALRQHPNIWDAAKIKVLERRKDADQECCSVLVSIGQDITEDRDPSSLLLARPTGSCCIVVYPELPIKSELSSSHTNLQEVALHTSPSPPESYCVGCRDALTDYSPPLSIASSSSKRGDDIRMLAQAILQMGPSKSETPAPQQYRKLKIFSGTMPTPTGEEAFEVWREYTSQVLEEWTCSESVKRQRIMECLRPPASTTIQMCKDQHADVTAHQMLKTLVRAYGRTEDIRQLMKRYYNLCQKEGEDLSDFLQRIQAVLWELRKRKRITATEVDEYRRAQFLSGALPTHPIVLMMRRSLMRGDPPSWEELMNEIKEHEVYARLHTSKKTKESPKSEPQGASAPKAKKPPSQKEEASPKILVSK
ncbi:paraneoplastic antigen Ma2 homolog [Ascaphus truei]|uniref:paraneoplastic antigen Ma2 homolog n=1 Tax=Ascaphus truei TaxID=8439 RepID=UPI003F59127A